MEVKLWSYDELPEFDEEVEGASYIESDGQEVGIHLHPNVEYAEIDGVKLHLEILSPYSRETRSRGKKVIYPCVVFVQGSAWLKQEVFSQIPLFSKLAEKGYVVAVVEYRHSGIASFPAQIQDARNAVRFMRVHAEEYQIDPDKMIIAGDSSGGHTAMFAGIMHDDDSDCNLYPGVSAETRGIINLYGSCSVMRWDGNPTTLNHKLPDSPEGLVMGGVNLRENEDLARKLSVECNITEETKISPVLIFHGTKDRTVNTYNSVDVYRQLKKCGKDASLYLIKGGDHGGAEYWTPETLSIMDAFIKRVIS